MTTDHAATAHALEAVERLRARVTSLEGQHDDAVRTAADLNGRLAAALVDDDRVDHAQAEARVAKLRAAELEERLVLARAAQTKAEKQVDTKAVASLQRAREAASRKMERANREAFDRLLDAKKANDELRAAVRECNDLGAPVPCTALIWTGFASVHGDGPWGAIERQARELGYAA